MSQVFGIASPFGVFSGVFGGGGGVIGEAVAQTAGFGALTLSGAGGYQIVDSVGNAITGASDAGTGTATGHAVSAGGVITPTGNGALSAQDGATIDIACDQGTATITLDIEADTYSASGNTEAAAALVAIGSAGAKTVRLRAGSYTGGRGILTDTRVFSSEVVITSYTRADVIFGSTWIEACQNLTFDSLTFAQAVGSQVHIYDACTGVIVQNCHIYGTTPIDPTGDYSVAGPTCPLGVVMHSGTGPHTNISILNNVIHDVDIGVNAQACQGTLRIEGNDIQNTYEDGIKVGPGPTSISIKDNYIAGVIANGADDGNPHPDFIQFLGKGGSDWTGIEIDRNIIVSLHSRAAAQGIFMDDMAATYFYAGAKIRGNLLVNKSGPTSGIRIRQAKDCEVYGNTVVCHLGLGSSGPGIRVGDDTTSGAHIVRNNAADSYSLSGTVTNENNITLGSAGATIAYTDAFAGSGFDPSTRAEALAMFTMKANGPLDVDDSGTASTGDAGAIGSGYVTLPSTFPGNDGALDADYETVTPVTLFQASEVGFFWNTTTAARLYQGSALSTPVTTTGQDVRSISDASGNDNHAEADAGAEPTWDATDLMLDFDGTQGISTAAYTQSNQIMNFACVIKTTDTQALVLTSKDLVSPWTLAFQDGSTSTDLTGLSGTPTIYVDGAVFSGNRDALHAAIADGSPHLVEVRNVMNVADWAGKIPTFGEYGGATVWNLVGGIGSPYLTSNDDDTALDGVRQWYVDNYGVSLA